MFPENWVQFVMKIVSYEDISPVMISNPIFWEKSEQMSFLFLSADLSKKVLMLHLYFRRDQSVLLRSQEFFFQKKNEKNIILEILFILSPAQLGYFVPIINQCLFLQRMTQHAKTCFQAYVASMKKVLYPRDWIRLHKLVQSDPVPRI